MDGALSVTTAASSPTPVSEAFDTVTEPAGQVTWATGIKLKT